MWVFYLISLPLTVAMVIFTLRYFAAPSVPLYVLFTVGYTWFVSLSIIILVPADIWVTISSKLDNGGISFFWSWSYWSTFLLTWAVVPLIQGFEDAGDFTVSERLKTSIHVNLVFYLIVGSIGLFGLILLIMMHRHWSGSILGFAMACSNTFGLVTGAFLLGFGLSEIPKNVWRNADWTTRQKVLSHKIAKMAVELDDAHQELSNAIVVAQATSKHMSRRDPLRPYMDVIDDILTQMFREDPSFTPQGGRLGGSDMDYDTDEKSMATLRRRLRGATEEYYRYKSEYMTYVLEALELEDTTKNYERRHITGWKYMSSIRPARTGKLESLFDNLDAIGILTEVSFDDSDSGIFDQKMSIITLDNNGFKFQCVLFGANANEMHQYILVGEQINVVTALMFAQIKIGKKFFWRCILRKQVEKGLAVLLGIMSVAILLAEATLLPSVDLSLFSILIKSVGTQEMLVQAFAFVPLMYMCICTYFSLFKIGRLVFYSLTPRQTSSVSLLMICSMIARYAPPVSYNFLNLIRLGSHKTTIFEQRMGNIDNAVPFFGDKFNKIFPLIMVIYTMLVASNFFDRVFDFLGSWRRYIFKTEAEDMDGFNPSGLIILQKERHWLEQGREVGEQVVPLARSFNSIDVESSNNIMEENGVEMKGTPKTMKEETRKYSSSREAISSKYAAVRQQSGQASKLKAEERNIDSAKVSLLDKGDTHGNTSGTSGLGSTWQTLKKGFTSFKADIGGAKGFLPIRQTQQDSISRVSSSESLDDIFQRLKKPSMDQAFHNNGSSR